MAQPEVPPFSVLIVAGGSGSRLGGEKPKQYQNLSDISVLEQCIKVFSSCKTLDKIHLVCDPAHYDFLPESVMTWITSPPAPAGKNRKESVFNGLTSILEPKSQEIILIHDAARPLICVEDIEKLAIEALKSGAATLAVPVADTLTRSDGTVIDRTDLWAVQTPQGFHYDLIRQAHETFKDDNSFTDDAGLVRALGHPVTLVPGSRRNFKITTADDLEMARNLMTNRSSETRTALGFDVHAFDPEQPGPIRLGGVDITHHCKLAGHSDADVGLHAITDALLGTIAAGDIGQHFPPSDPQWKGADSSVFLSHAVKLLHEKNAVITLIDLTFMCEEPKIGPHRDAMQRVIASITGLSPDRISIKATTTEKLGFTGRKEGIAAQALATVQLS